MLFFAAGLAGLVIVAVVTEGLLVGTPGVGACPAAGFRLTANEVVAIKKLQTVLEKIEDVIMMQPSFEMRSHFHG